MHMCVYVSFCVCIAGAGGLWSLLSYSASLVFLGNPMAHVQSRRLQGQEILMAIDGNVIPDTRVLPIEGATLGSEALGVLGLTCHRKGAEPS